VRKTLTDPRLFDDLPVVFDDFAQLFGGPLRAYLTARILGSANRAVDLGCGTGLHATLLAPHFAEILGVDVSAPMLEFARTHRPHANVRYEQRDLRDVSAARDGQFDLVFSAYTLHHVPDLPEVLRQIRALVRPGGQLLLIDNVDPRRQVPRAWFKAEARKGTGGRPAAPPPARPAGVRAYRRNTNRGLLDHFTTDVFLTPEDFEACYREVFPGADVTPMYRSRAVRWHAPGAPTGEPRDA
jgi:SAM-dependent methyltransferase